MASRSNSFKFRTYLPIQAIEDQLEPCGYTIVKPGDTAYSQDDAAEIQRHADRLLQNAKFVPIMQAFNLRPDGFMENADVNVGDEKREQAAINGRTRLAQKLSAVARRKVKGVTPGDFVFLGRKSGCEKQHDHRDAKSGAFLVYALSDNYTLRVYDGSHMPVADVRQRMQQYTDGEQLDTVQGEGRLITLQKGEFVIVHGCCVHAGGPASADQDTASDTHQDLAVHAYLDDDSAPPREKNVTYPVLPNFHGKNFYDKNACEGRRIGTLYRT